MSDRTESPATAHLLRPLARALVGLLRGLDASAWSRRTSAPAWSVKDVVAHLLELDLRRISVVRDGHLPPPPTHAIESHADLVVYLNQLNAEWIAAARRLSSRVLTDCIEFTGERVADLAEAADPWATATFPVSWTGAASSPVWLDIGREYTERWHHQDQIREAVGAPPLRSREWLHPVIAISLRALPHAYRSLAAPPGTRIVLHVAGDGGGVWHLERAAGWQLRAGDVADPACVLRADDLALARLLLHRLPPHAASAAVRVEGPERLAAPLLTARAVVV